MENCEKFFETADTFKSDLAKVGKAANLQELNALEAKCVNELQLMIVELELCGRDLKAARDKRERELRNA